MMNPAHMQKLPRASKFVRNPFGKKASEDQARHEVSLRGGNRLTRTIAERMDKSAGSRSWPRPTAAFTLVELLVVITILGLLAALLFPVLRGAKSRALSTDCLSNMKQFNLAFHMYADDNNQRVLPNLGGENVPLGRTWVEGWLGVPGPDCTNTLYLQRSLVGPYVKQGIKIWRCPANHDRVLVEGLIQARVRTFSMNHFIGAPWDAPGTTSYRKLTDLTQPSPSDAFTFIEERTETINDGTFAVRIDFDESSPATWIINDLPGTDHDRGSTVTFADGHQEAHHWRDARTVSAKQDVVPMPLNDDVLWLEQHSTRRMP